MQDDPESYRVPPNYVLTLYGLEVADRVDLAEGGYVNSSEIILHLGTILPYRIGFSSLPLDPSITKREIRMFLEQFGEVAFSAVQADPDSRPRHFRMNENPSYFFHSDYAYVKDVELLTLLKLKFG